MRRNLPILTTAVAALALCAGLLVICNKKPVTTAGPVRQNPPLPLPTTAPTTAPATQPVASSMLINQILKQFPQARVQLVADEDHVTAVLYSADPPAAINNDYTGNSFYLRMPLNDVKDLASINGAEWRYKSLSSDRVDSSDGIYLDGLNHHQLQPDDVVVRFEGTGPTLRVRLIGQFRDYDNTTPQMPGVLTTVSADLAADVDTGPKQ